MQEGDGGAPSRISPGQEASCFIRPEYVWLLTMFAHNTCKMRAAYKYFPFSALYVYRYNISSVDKRDEKKEKKKKIRFYVRAKPAIFWSKLNFHVLGYIISIIPAYMYIFSPVPLDRARGSSLSHWPPSSISRSPSLSPIVLRHLGRALNFHTS